MRENLTDAVKAKAAINKLKPVEKDFIGLKGFRHEREYRKDGSYTWRARYEANKGTGKMTREANIVHEMMKPYAKAATEYNAHQQAATPKLAIRPPTGGLQYVTPDRAEGLLQGGWREAAPVKGERCERGDNGMLWKLTRRGWIPTGRWCLGRPFTQSSRPETGKRDGSMKLAGLHYSPHDDPWRYIDGRWEAFPDAAQEAASPEQGSVAASAHGGGN